MVESGRSEAAARAATSHTSALAGKDEAYNAAFRRAGIIRVDTIAQLFNCAEALSKMNRPLGGNLDIITNAGGPGVMAVDAFSKWELEPAALSPETVARLDQGLPHRRIPSRTAEPRVTEPRTRAGRNCQCFKVSGKTNFLLQG